MTARWAREASTPLWPTLLYLATALVGVWAAYDRPAALARFALLTLGLIAAIGIGRLAQRRGGDGGGVFVAAAVVAAAIGVYYVLAYDPVASGSLRFWALQRILLRIQTHRPALPLAPLHKNAAGGALAVLLPFALVALYWAWSKRRWGWLAIVATTLLIALTAFILVASRGAWLGFSLGILAAAFLYVWSTSLRSASGRAASALGWAGPLVLVGLPLAGLLTFAAALTIPRFYGLLLLPTRVGGLESLTRVQIWWDAVTLIEDYPLTGSGLGSTAMVYSSYVRLLSVPYFSHMHNLYLQLAVEQGLPGLLAFLWLVGSALQRLIVGAMHERSASVSRLAALASLVALLAHGMLDAQLFVSPLVPLVFLPLGCALALSAPDAPSDTSTVRASRASSLAFLWPWGVTTVALTAVVLLPGARSRLVSNLAAVMQTRAELSVYTFQEWGFQDAVRRARVDDLGPALAAYQLALDYDPTDAVANRRLGQIELSLGRYDLAGQHLEAAYRANPLPRPAGLLLGEYYVTRGEIQAAVRLWSTTMDVREEYLKTRQAWYEHIGEHEVAQRFSTAVTALFADQPSPEGVKAGS